MERFEFTCSRCGEVHEGSPSFGYSSPHQYDELDEGEKQELAFLSDDFCTIGHPEQTDRFIRAVLEVPIDGVEEPFLWGVWISLSEKNYENLKARALVKPGDQRPTLELEPTEHPLALDCRIGISWERAVDIVQIARHGEEA